MRLLFVAAVAAGLVLAAPVAFAEPTNIIRMPTGDVRDRGEIMFGATGEYNIDSDSDDETDIGLALLSGFGLTDRIEVGLNIYEADDDPEIRGDIAYQFIQRPSDEGGFAAKVGLDRIGRWEETLVYAAGTYRTGDAGLTAGLGYQDDELGFLAGGEVILNPRWGAFAEYNSTGGDEARIGGRYFVRPNLVASVYYARENDGDREAVGVSIRARGSWGGFS